MSQKSLSLKFFEAHCVIFPTKERCPIKIQRIGKISTGRWEERDFSVSSIFNRVSILISEYRFTMSGTRGRLLNF